jgi:RHS repeat-associated protein
MESAQIPALHEPPLAAMPQLREKPHLGFSSKNPALHQVHEACNSTTALGFRAALHLERIRSRYTGKERDTESGNDYFEARYYSSAMGRFMSPDWSAKEEPVPYAKMDDPQSLNLYAYVRNNPLGSVDLDGHDCSGSNAGQGFCNSQVQDNMRQGMSAGDAYAGWQAQQGQAQQQSSPGASAASGSVPTIQGVAASGTYSSRKAAGIAAEKAAIGDTRAAKKHGKVEEWGGWVISKNGKFTYTVPVTFGDPGHFFGDNVTIPEGYAAVGGYHTHPGPDPAAEDGFSGADCGFANRHGMPEYLGVTANGNIRVFNPGPYDRWLGAPGTVIGNAP